MSFKSTVKHLQKSVKQKIVMSMLRQKIKPTHDFDANRTPAAPDYNQMVHWAAHPNKTNTSQMVPEGVKQPVENPEADVFFVYPTMLFSKEHWNAPLDHERTNEFVDNMILPGQASIFNENCRVFAPRYRQVTFYSFLEASTNSHSAFHVAYQDLLMAFNHYLEHENKGRPFIIAGHSQGSLLCLRLLEDIIDPSALVDQLIAAYLIGFQIPQDKLGRTLHHIKAAAKHNDTACIVAFDSFGENGGPLHDRDHCQHYYSDSEEWEYRRHKDVISINPLSWQLNSSLSNAEQHHGSVKLNFTKESKFDWQHFFSDDPMGIKIQSLYAPRPGECSAQLDDKGFLHISEPITRSYRLGLMPNENYHIHDMALFYMNLRANVKDRIEAWFQTKKQ